MPGAGDEPVGWRRGTGEACHQRHARAEGRSVIAILHELGNTTLLPWFCARHLRVKAGLVQFVSKNKPSLSGGSLPSCSADATNARSTPQDSSRRKSSTPRTPPPAINSTCGCTFLIRPHKSSVPTPSPPPTRAKSSTIRRRTPASIASSTIDQASAARQPATAPSGWPSLRSSEKIRRDPPVRSSSARKAPGPSIVSSPATQSTPASSNRRPSTSLRTPASTASKNPRPWSWA